MTGIDTERVVMWTWIIAGVMAAAAGIFLAMDTRLHPTMGWRILLSVFAAVILGGIGKPYGAIAGGMVMRHLGRRCRPCSSTRPTRRRCPSRSWSGC